MADIVLHHYWESPYAEKIRRILGFKQLAWKSVIIPMIMPKPDLLALTGGYRKTPVMQVGADIYCDTDCIARVIERLHPKPSLFPEGTDALSYMIGPWQGELFLLAVMLVTALGSAYVGLRVGRQMERNIQCCQLLKRRNLPLSLRETLGLAPPFYSQIGQDKWVLERMFPGERHGFFLDVGSGDGTQLSNSKALEERGWTGLCVDPFPKNMDGRTCRMFKAVVFSEPGRTLRFHAAGDTGGLADTLGALKESAVTAPTVELTTTTLQAILQEAKAPDLGKLSVLAGVRDFPTRVKCASLAWHTMKAAVAHDPSTTLRAGSDAPVSTE